MAPRDHFTHLQRMVCILLCAGAAVWSAGCRKSADELREEKREQRAQLQEAQWRYEQAEANAQYLFEKGKDFQRENRYEEALEAWAKALQADKRVDLMVALAKNGMADEMLDRAHYQMHRPYENPAYPASSRRILELIVDKKNSFLGKHVDKASKELGEWDRIKGGWEKFYQAQRLIDGHQLAEGLDILEEICKAYPRTPLADKCILLLRQYGRN
jgi:tetratricopeptide (TPR) repeat protein